MIAVEISPKLKATQAVGEHEKNNPIEVEYTNYRGEKAVRTVIPLRHWYGKTEYHNDHDQWLLDVWDVEKDAPRTYALKDISKWLVK